MRKFALTALVSAVALAGPAFAEGDVDAGEKNFKKCKSCHMIANGDNVIVKGGKTGPNLYGLVGRAVASSDDFKYGDSLAALGATGAVWDEASIVAYITDPSSYLKTALSDDGAKSKMTLKLKKGGEDVVAYLKSVTE